MPLGTKRAILTTLQVLAGFFLWFWAVGIWRNWLPFYTDYGDVSRIEAKGIAITVALFIAAQYTTYSLRRWISK